MIVSEKNLYGLLRLGQAVDLVGAGGVWDVRVAVLGGDGGHGLCLSFRQPVPLFHVSSTPVVKQG
jgi:hypothetical protein